MDEGPLCPGGLARPHCVHRMKEASARIKINALLAAAGWRFFADTQGPANIQLEPSVPLGSQALDDLGENFEKTTKGFIDFLLLNEKGFPWIVLEAKAGHKDPLVGKEQARRYAKSQNCRFVILSNGDLHYFWDLHHGNPSPITAFPTPSSVAGCQSILPDPARLAGEPVGEDYVVLTQRPGYASEAAWLSGAERPQFIQANGLRFLRHYQREAVLAVQHAVSSGRQRFLLEMATGTGKTLTAAALIKLFLRTGNARRALFLVDRIELEDQALKSFRKVLANDFKSVIYKESRDDWRHAEIVVATVQSLLFNNKYQRLFSPADFDLVISDEAHRSIGGNARAVFDHFLGWKLGLTATPRDYLKRFDKDSPPSGDPREFERRLLLDTYRTFGCDDGQPTYRYSLLDGVRDGFLINPTVVDARSEVTTRLISAVGFLAKFTDENGGDQEEAYRQREFEKHFFSPATNQLFCKTFLDHALRDPVSEEIGKSILFAVSQSHAAKLAHILNAMADRMFPGKYQSDFAAQVTSQVDGARQHTLNFTNNTLLGSANFLPAYKTSKTRVCVTVGMMTTGYDCPDLLNIGLLRPIFSPTDFIQIKGRGTRTHDFRENLHDGALRETVAAPRKTTFKLFDFFANCEFFEEEFNYDQVLKLPKADHAPYLPDPSAPATPTTPGAIYHHKGQDLLDSIREEPVGPGGMRIDREFYARFEDVVRQDNFVAANVAAGEWDRVVDYVAAELFHKPAEFYSLDKLRKAAGVDRRLSLREILEKIFGLIPGFKSKDDLLEEEFSKFLAGQRPDDPESVPAIKTYFKACATSPALRSILASGHLTDLATNPAFSTKDYKAVPAKYRTLVPDYIRDYVSLNQFAA